jgi:hypothetical protein
MKKQISTAMVAGIIVVVLLVIGVLYWQFGGTRTSGKQIDDVISKSAMSGGKMAMPGGPAKK